MRKRAHENSMITTNRNTAEHRLLCAILLTAAADYCGRAILSNYRKSNVARRRAEIKEDARLFFEDRSWEAFSLNWICQHLELDAESIRRNKDSPAFATANFFRARGFSETTL